MGLGQFTLSEWRKIMTWIKDGIIDAGVAIKGTLTHYTGTGIFLEDYGNSIGTFIYAWDFDTGTGRYLSIQGKPLKLCDDPSNGGVTVGSLSDPGYGYLNVLNNATINGHSVIQNLASGNGKVAITSGLSNISSSGSATISFPASFSSNPNVIAVPNNSSVVEVSISAVTTSSFTVKAWDGSNNPAPTNVYWIAIGPVS